jgi:hypothetical protein
MPSTPSGGPTPLTPPAPAGAIATVLDDAATLITNRRGLTDIHPKVAVAALLGALVTIVLWVLQLTGHPLDAVWAGLITTTLATAGGYLTPSSS